MKKLKRLLVFFMLVLPFSVTAESPDGSVYIDGGDNKNGILLAHGKGKHPKWLVVDPVRKGVNKALGYHTLSLQMPTGYSHWKDYADGFTDAYNRIEEGIAYLKNEKGVSNIYLFGHSMGGVCPVPSYPKIQRVDFLV